MCTPGITQGIADAIKNAGGMTLGNLDEITKAITNPVNDVVEDVGVYHPGVPGTNLAKEINEGWKSIEKTWKDVVVEPVEDVHEDIVDEFQNIEDTITGDNPEGTGEVTPEVGTTDEDEETDEDEDEDTVPELLLGRMAAGRRTLGEGRGIGANILTSGRGVGTDPRTRRRTLLG